MLLVTVNRTMIIFKCKHPDYVNEAREKYICDARSGQWKLIYQNNNYTCRKFQT